MVLTDCALLSREGDATTGEACQARPRTVLVLVVRFNGRAARFDFFEF